MLIILYVYFTSYFLLVDFQVPYTFKLTLKKILPLKIESRMILKEYKKKTVRNTNTKLVLKGPIHYLVPKQECANSVALKIA